MTASDDRGARVRLHCRVLARGDGCGRRRRGGSVGGGVVAGCGGCGGGRACRGARCARRGLACLQLGHPLAQHRRIGGREFLAALVQRQGTRRCRPGTGRTGSPDSASAAAAVASAVRWRLRRRSRALSKLPALALCNAQLVQERRLAAAARSAAPAAAPPPVPACSAHVLGWQCGVATLGLAVAHGLELGQFAAKLRLNPRCRRRPLVRAACVGLVQFDGLLFEGEGLLFEHDVVLLEPRHLAQLLGPRAKPMSDWPKSWYSAAVWKVAAVVTSATCSSEAAA